MTIKVRFAPSPTGKVHIGNIRAAIFNYLFARHENGKFLIRVEDTDIERSTKEAVDALFDVLTWMNLEYDGEPLYQRSQADHHLAMAKKLEENNDAYWFAKGDGGEALLYRIPWNCDNIPNVKTFGTTEIKIHPDNPVTIDFTGIKYFGVSKKGKAVEQDACLAGFYGLEIVDAEGSTLFTLNDKIESILAKQENFQIANGVRLRFTRRAISYTDLVKGELVKPLDSMRDQVIVRSTGAPVFHLSNVCDDITQGITHIIRGDDHVENTYRHLFLFHSLGGSAPLYAHLPMIVNRQGKPYSKRDGDAFVGDFKSKGYRADTLFNYLSLLGWSPGNDQEKLSKKELVAAFTLDRVKSNPAQMDMKKLTDLNGQYIAEESDADFLTQVEAVLKDCDWFTAGSTTQLTQVANLMKSRTTLYTDAQDWKYFFCSDFPMDEKALKKSVHKGDNPTYLRELLTEFTAMEAFTFAAIETKVKEFSAKKEIGEYQLFQPLRVATTGIGRGAELFDLLELFGKEQTCQRIETALNYNFE